LTLGSASVQQDGSSNDLAHILAKFMFWSSKRDNDHILLRTALFSLEVKNMLIVFHLVQSSLSFISTAIHQCPPSTTIQFSCGIRTPYM